jgi:hypothetical protein
MSELLIELEGLLRTHDWTYQHSDDYRAWTKGSRESQAIRCLRQKCEDAGLKAEATDLVNVWVGQG